MTSTCYVFSKLYGHSVWLYTVKFKDYIILQISSGYISSTPIQQQVTTYCETNFVLAIFIGFNAVLRVQCFIIPIYIGVIFLSKYILYFITSVRSLMWYTTMFLLPNWRNGFDRWTGRWIGNWLDDSIQRIWTNNSMFYRAKCYILLPGLGQSPVSIQIGCWIADNIPVQKDLGILVEEKWIWAIILHLRPKKPVVSWVSKKKINLWTLCHKEGDSSTLHHSHKTWPGVKNPALSFSLKTEMDILEHIQKRATKVISGTPILWRKAEGVLGFLSLEKKELQEGLIMVF